MSKKKTTVAKVTAAPVATKPAAPAAKATKAPRGKQAATPPTTPPVADAAPTVAPATPAVAAPAPAPVTPPTVAPAKPKTPGVAWMKTRSFIAGQIIKKYGIEAGVTDAMVIELDEAYGKPNPIQSRYDLSGAWHACRGFAGVTRD